MLEVWGMCSLTLGEKEEGAMFWHPKRHDSDAAYQFRASSPFSRQWGPERHPRQAPGTCEYDCIWGKGLCRDVIKLLRQRGNPRLSGGT